LTLFAVLAATGWSSPGITPAPSTASAASSSADAQVGVPTIDPDYDSGVEAWWANHPFNPASPRYVPKLTPLPNAIDVAATYGSDLQAAIDALPAEGGTLYLGPGTYDRATVVGRSNVHLTGAGQGVTILHGIEMYGCADVEHYSAFVTALFNRQEPSVSCILHPARNILFQDLTFDGEGHVPINGDHYMTNIPVFLRAVRDVAFEDVEFRNMGMSDEWHPGYVTGNAGIDNVWCRRCTFQPGFRFGWFLDGARASGVVESSFKGYFKSGGILFLTNDDATADLNGDGTVDQFEERTPRFNVVANNRFEGVGFQAVAMNGWQSLVTRNVSTAALDRLVTITARCSNRFYTQGTVYRMYDDVVSGNSVAGARFLVEVDGQAGLGCVSNWETDPLTQQYRGRIGRYVVKENCVVAADLRSTVNELGPIDGPNVVERNPLGDKDCLSRA
jgi:hypothetical protein